MDSVARYTEASERNDIPAMMEALSDSPELVSPISGRMVFRGRDDLEQLLGAIYGLLKDLRWTDRVGEGSSTQVILGEARIGPLRLTDAMVFELAPDGRIGRIRPHLRPWLALTLLALALGPRVKPGMVRRALAG